MDIAEQVIRAKEDYDAVYEAGADKATKELWDKYLNYKEGSGMNNAAFLFGGLSWNDETFYPPKDIRLVGYNSRVFASNGCTNLRQRLVDCGVKIGGSNTTNLTGVQAFFMGARTEELPDFENAAFSTCDQFCSGCPNLKWFPDYDFSRCTNYLNIFLNCEKLEQIVALDVGRVTNTSGAFSGCTSLTEIRLRGTLSVSIDFKYSPLSVASMKSVISALKDCSVTDNGKYTVGFLSDCWTALEESGKPFDDGLTDDESKTWQEYVSLELGWNT